MAQQPIESIEELRKPFKPEEHGLDKSWRLTSFSDLKGWGCKVPRETLLRLLEVLNPTTAATLTKQQQQPETNNTNNNHSETNGHSQQTTTLQNGHSSASATLGIGMDSCVIPLRHSGLHLLQTTDFFYPLIEDPYTMGRIACANVLSDLYAMGCVNCDNMLVVASFLR